MPAEGIAIASYKCAGGGAEEGVHWLLAGVFQLPLCRLNLSATFPMAPLRQS